MLIKVFRPADEPKQCCIARIYATHYDNTLIHIRELARELRQDFPGLANDGNIRVKTLDNKRSKGMTAVEVELPSSTPAPLMYSVVRELDYML